MVYYTNDWKQFQIPEYSPRWYIDVFETFQFCKPHYDVEEFGSAMGRVAGLVSEQ